MNAYGEWVCSKCWRTMCLIWIGDRKALCARCLRMVWQDDATRDQREGDQ
jgi:hypothetical protein